MRTLFLIALLIVATIERPHFMDPLKKKNFKKMPEKIPHSYDLIAEEVNNMKTTWKVTTYKKDYRPLLGAILDGGMELPKKTFKETNLNLPESFDPRDEYPNCE